MLPFVLGAEAAAPNPAMSIDAVCAKALDKYKAGDVDGALDGYRTALAMQKDFPAAVYGQAAILFVKGDFQAASNGLQSYMNDVESDNFAWMWAYVAQARAGNPDRPTLSQMQAMVDEGTWFYSTLSLFLGTVSPEKYLADAKQSEDATRAEAVCRAQWLVAESYILAKDNDKAKAALTACVEAPGPFQWEREMGKAELKRIQEPPAPKAGQ
jgi:lipoprotein NlpI